MSFKASTLNYNNVRMDPWLAAILENPDLAGSAIRALMPLIKELEPVDTELQAVAMSVFEQQAGLNLAVINSSVLSARKFPPVAVPATTLSSVAGLGSAAPASSSQVSLVLKSSSPNAALAYSGAVETASSLRLSELQSKARSRFEESGLVASSKPALVAKDWIRELGYATLFEIGGLSQQFIASSYPRSKDVYWGCITARGTVAGIQLETDGLNYLLLPGERFTINGFEIGLLRKEALPSGVTRCFYEIKDMARLSSRIFTHLQLKWPDFGVPSAASFMELLMAQQESLREQSFRETLIHCRGGMGRTGTVIYAIVLSELRGDPEAVLKQLRMKRPLVETTIQQKLAIAVAEVLSGALTLEALEEGGAKERATDRFSSPFTSYRFSSYQASTFSDDDDHDDVHSTLIHRSTVAPPVSAFALRSPDSQRYLLSAASIQPPFATSLLYGGLRGSAVSANLLHESALFKSPAPSEALVSSRGVDSDAVASCGLSELEKASIRRFEESGLGATNKPAVVARDWIREVGHTTQFQIEGLSQQLIASSYPRSKDAYWGCISTRGTMAGIQLEIDREDTYNPRHNYHPLPGERFTINGFEIRLVRQEILPCGVIRRLYGITDMTTLSGRIFTHLQLIWPDSGVPSAASFVELLRAQQEALSEQSFRETIIHCGWGSGPTGTVIYAIVLSELRGDPEVVLKQLRMKRPLVETPAQEKLAIGAAEVLSGALKLEEFEVREEKA